MNRLAMMVLKNLHVLPGIYSKLSYNAKHTDTVPEIEKYRTQYADIAKSDEDVLSLALFPQVAPDFLKWRDDPNHVKPVDEVVKPAAPAPKKEEPKKAEEPVRELIVEY